MTAQTSQKLADTLRAAGLGDLASRAEADEFHDFLSPHGFPEMLLAEELAAITTDPTRTTREQSAAHHIRQRLIDGEFDASVEESEEWAKSAEGQEAFRRLARGE